MKKKDDKKKKSQVEDVEEGLQIVSIDDIDKIESKSNVNTKKNKSYMFGKSARIIITIVALIVFAVAGYNLYEILDGYKKAADSYSDLDGKYTKVSANRIEEEDEEFPDEFVNFYVDFEGLRRDENADVVAWIKFEGVDISYPVVKGSDNSYYLTHTTKNEENKSGSIFMDYNNNADLSDMNTIIYGHNMKDGSMFGLMGQYKEEEFYSGKERFWIYTPEGAFCYYIFSCYEPMADDNNVYSIWREPCEAYKLYLDAAKQASRYPTIETALDENTQIVTLSTCTSRGSDYRFVVQGKLVKKFPNR